LFDEVGALRIRGPHSSLRGFAERRGFVRGQGIDAAADHIAFDLLLDAGDADFEKLIEVGAGDAKKLHPLEQRIAGIQRFIQDALIKLQPAQLPVLINFDNATEPIERSDILAPHHASRQLRFGAAARFIEL
jgi:hypothetical protein